MYDLKDKLPGVIYVAGTLADQLRNTDEKSFVEVYLENSGSPRFINRFMVIEIDYQSMVVNSKILFLFSI